MTVLLGMSVGLMSVGLLCSDWFEPLARSSGWHFRLAPQAPFGHHPISHQSLLGPRGWLDQASINLKISVLTL